MAELGIPGIALLVILVGGVLVGLAHACARVAALDLRRAARGRRRLGAARGRGLGLGDARRHARLLRRRGRGPESPQGFRARLGAERRTAA